MTLTMPKGQNPSLFGAAMRTLKDLKLTFDHSIALCQAINILTKNKLEKKKLLAVLQWKKFVVPLMEEDLLEIELELIKRRWQTNIQMVRR